MMLRYVKATRKLELTPGTRVSQRFPLLKRWCLFEETPFPYQKEKVTLLVNAMHHQSLASLSLPVYSLEVVSILMNTIPGLLHIPCQI